MVLTWVYSGLTSALAFASLANIASASCTINDPDRFCFEQPTQAYHITVSRQFDSSLEYGACNQNYRRKDTSPLYSDASYFAPELVDYNGYPSDSKKYKAPSDPQYEGFRFSHRQLQLSNLQWQTILSSATDNDGIDGLSIVTGRFNLHSLENRRSASHLTAENTQQQTVILLGEVHHKQACISDNETKIQQLFNFHLVEGYDGPGHKETKKNRTNVNRAVSSYDDAIAADPWEIGSNIRFSRADKENVPFFMVSTSGVLLAGPVPDMTIENKEGRQLSPSEVSRYFSLGDVNSSVVDTPKNQKLGYLPYSFVTEKRFPASVQTLLNRGAQFAQKVSFARRLIPAPVVPHHTHTADLKKSFRENIVNATLLSNTVEEAVRESLSKEQVNMISIEYGKLTQIAHTPLKDINAFGEGNLCQGYSEMPTAVCEPSYYNSVLSSYGNGYFRRNYSAQAFYEFAARMEPWHPRDIRMAANILAIMKAFPKQKTFFVTVGDAHRSRLASILTKYHSLSTLLERFYPASERPAVISNGPVVKVPKDW